MNKKIDLSMDEDQRQNNKEKYWLYCPVCNNKTRTQVREDSILINFPLYCPKCKQETLISVKHMRISVITEPDAQTQSR